MVKELRFRMQTQLTGVIRDGICSHLSCVCGLRVFAWHEITNFLSDPGDSRKPFFLAFQRTFQQGWGTMEKTQPGLTGTLLNGSHSSFVPWGDWWMTKRTIGVREARCFGFDKWSWGVGAPESHSSLGYWVSLFNLSSLIGLPQKQLV